MKIVVPGQVEVSAEGAHRMVGVTVLTQTLKVSSGRTLIASNCTFP